MANEHMVKLIMGDPSDDGHGKWGYLVYATNLSQPDIRKYYNVGVEIIGYNYIQEVARDYEDNYIHGHHVIPLVKAGIDVGNIVDDYEEPPSRLILIPKEDWTEKDEENYEEYCDETRGYVYTDAHAELYLNIVRIGAAKEDVEFTFEQIRDDIPEIDIEGYGLF